MNIAIRHGILGAFAVCAIVVGVVAFAEPPAVEVNEETSKPVVQEPPVPELAIETVASVESADHAHFHGRNRSIVHIGSDSDLPAGESAESVVAVAGSSTSDGDVVESVVAVMGNARVTGRVGDAVVAVMGNVYVNSKIGGDVVAVMGDLELGPQAEVSGDVVSVGGRLIRDPAAIVHGDLQEVAFPIHIGQLEWIRPWVRHALLYGRPLAIDPGLGWAWALSLGFLAFYALIALLFPGAMQRCVSTLETRPGACFLAALLSVMLTPILILLLLITVVGIFVLPFLAFAFFCIGLFGKAVVLAAIGRRLIRHGEYSGVGAAMAVLVGGAIILVLYLIPIVGFIVYPLTGLLGFGVVAYTLLLGARSNRESRFGGMRPAAADAASVGAAASAGSPRATPFISSAPLDSEPSISTTHADDSVLGAQGPAMSASSETDPNPAPAQSVPVSEAGSFARATFMQRMAALLIDIVLVAVIVNMMFDRGEMFGTFLLPLAVYGAVMWKLKGSTIGGIVFNIQVVRLDGRPIDWATSIVRALSCFLSLVAAGIGFLWILFDNDRQAWHDKIAGTVVVRLPKGISLV